MSSQFISGLLGVREIAPHAICGCEKVKVVAVIHHVVHAACCAALSKIDAVRIGPCRSAVSGRRVVSYSHVGMRGHVHQMAGGRCEGFQTLRAGKCPLGVGRRLHSVDVVVICAQR